MRRETIPSVLVVSALLFVVAACGRTETDAVDPARKAEERPAKEMVAYEGPRKPGDAEWSLRSLDGRDAAEGSNIRLLFPVEGELAVNGGCLGFALYHELEGDGLRVVEPGLQTGRLECGKPEAVQRQAEGVLDIVRDLAGVRIGEDRLELRGGSGEVAVFAHPPPARVDADLLGTEWLLTSLEGEAPMPEARITLEIGKEAAGGNSGCNYYGNEIDVVDGGRVTWKNGKTGFGMTAMGCAGDVLRQETRYLDALTAAETYSLENDRLVLANGEGRTTLVFEQKVRWQSDPADLARTSWALRSTDGREPERGSVPTVRFGSDKEISYYDGCQNFEGRYIATENDLSVPDLGVVGGDCMKPEAFGASDGPCLVGCFAPEGDYRLRDGLLEIRSETGETTTILEPLPDGERPKQEGTPWELRSFVEDGEKTPVVGEEPVTLTFDRGTLRSEGAIFGSAGCNDYRVSYQHPIARKGPDRLSLGQPVVTRRKCIGRSLAVQEERFLGVLQDVSYYPLISADGQMTLEAGDGRKLIFSAPETAERRPT